MTDDGQEFGPPPENLHPVSNVGWLWFRCPICMRRGWRGIVWHGTASDLLPVMVHKPCGLAASAEFVRGLEMGAPTPPP